jgi:hypothetical protein
MKKNHWEVFQWIRNGEGGGNLEGYAEDVFEYFTEKERKEAEELLISDYKNHRNFSAQGLAMLLKEGSEQFFKKELARNDINLYQKIHLSSLLTYATKDFLHANIVVELLKNNELSIRKAAVDNLYLIKKLIPNSSFKIIANIIIDEAEPMQRYKLGRLIHEASGMSVLKDLDIDVKLANSKKELAALVKRVN